MGKYKDHLDFFLSIAEREMLMGILYREQGRITEKRFASGEVPLEYIETEQKRINRLIKKCEIASEEKVWPSTILVDGLSGVN